MYLKHRLAIERMYTDICSIYEFEEVEKGSITTYKKTLRHKDVKCFLSHKSSNPTSQTNITNNIVYDVKLFTNPEIDIKPGSHISVNRLGRIYEFKSSGEAFVYVTHQEIILKRLDTA